MAVPCIAGLFRLPPLSPPRPPCPGPRRQDRKETNGCANDGPAPEQEGVGRMSNESAVNTPPERPFVGVDHPDGDDDEEDASDGTNRSANRRVISRRPVCHGEIIGAI